MVITVSVHAHQIKRQEKRKEPINKIKNKFGCAVFKVFLFVPVVKFANF